MLSKQSESYVELLNRRGTRCEQQRVARATAKRKREAAAPTRTSFKEKTEPRPVDDGGSNLDHVKCSASKEASIEVVEVELSDEDFVDYRKKLSFKFQLE